MTKTTNWPATVRELGDMAAQRGVMPSELLGVLETELGPMPMPPAGYTLAKGTDGVWIGEDITHRQYMIQPAWHAPTNSRTVELWTAKGSADESYTPLTPLEALQLASDLIALAKDALAGDGE